MKSDPRSLMTTATNTPRHSSGNPPASGHRRGRLLVALVVVILVVAGYVYSHRGDDKPESVGAPGSGVVAVSA
jgi:hypothetical protein